MNTQSEVALMQFCPECKKVTMMYVHGLRKACCTNPDCLFDLYFETYADSQKVLLVKEEEYSKATGKKRVPWSQALEEIKTAPERMESLAAELHEVFSKASIVHKFMDLEDYAPYEELPWNVKEALKDLACYVDKHFIRRK